MTVTLKAMRYFTTALRYGNISRAADSMNVAPSAVGAALDQIEAQFQLQLVTRHRARGIEPTRAGNEMARKFERLLEEYDAILSEGRDLQQALSGTLRLGYYAPIAPAFLPGIVADLVPPWGEVALALTECDNTSAQAGLIEGRFDAILFVPDGTHPEIEFNPILQAPAYALLPADHPLCSQQAIRLADLADLPMIALNRPMVTDYYRQIFSALGREPNTVIQADTTEMVRSLVGAGLGYAVLNMRPKTDVSYAGDHLETRPILGAGPPLTLAVGYNKSNPRRVVSTFVSRCMTWAQSEQASEFIVPQPE
ncbi:MAG: LysR family transcriptional regulator [Rhodobacteraceae bacterium]|nr:LysR family transcriptional regulator [Paracoccaceae bacterium]